MFLLVLVGGALALSCNSNDRLIMKGSSLRSNLRALGGLFVNQAEYEESVKMQIGLTQECAKCYGNAYICGKNNCKWSCILEGVGCDECLTGYRCIQECNKCTSS